MLFVLCVIASCSGQLESGDDWKVINVKDYGAAGDGVTDDTKAIRKALEAAVRAKGAIVNFENKTYYLGETPDSWFHFELHKARDIEINGNGALLLSCPKNQMFSIKGSRNISLRNLNIDYSPLPFTQGRVTAVNFNEGYFDFSISEGYPKNIMDYYYNKTDDRFHGWSHSIIMNPDMESRNEEMTMDHLYISDAEQLSPSEYRLHVHERHITHMKGMKTGDGVILGLGFTAPFEELFSKRPDSFGRQSCLYINDSRDITVDCLKMYSCPGRWVRMTDNTGAVYIQNSSFAPPAGTDRKVSSILDGIHALNNKENVVLSGCSFVGAMDDLVACCLKEDVVKEVLPDNVVKLTNADNVNTLYSMDVGNELMFVKKYKGNFLGSAKIVEIFSTEGRTNIVKLDREVPGLVAVDDKMDEEAVVAMNYGRASSGFRITDNYFKPVLRRALAITWCDGFISGNVLDCVGGGSIWMMNLAPSFTGPFIRNVTVNANVIRNSSHTSLMIGAAWTRVSKPEIFDSNLTIIGNTIENQKGHQPAVKISNMKNIRLHGNSITMEYPDEEKISLVNCENILQ